LTGDDPIGPPQPLGVDHDVSAFSSGSLVLDDWLKRRALANQGSGALRTYVVSRDRLVIGYYSLAAGAVATHEATGRARRNMPNPIPVMILARLAVDREAQGRGLGRALLGDAIRRTLQAAAIAGIRAILVHAISAEAKAFYERAGFQPSPIDPMTLMITLQDVRRAAEASPGNQV
jgi:GNAT superfamily N-acetyltransferase